MIEFHLQLDPVVVAQLRDTFSVLAKSIEEPLVGLPTTEDGEVDDSHIDAELASFWNDSLRESVQLDVQTLLNFMEDDKFSGGTVKLEESEVEHMLRASSALRLRLRETLLASISDSSLENATFVPGDQPPLVLHAYGCYQFLAEIQILLIHALDPESVSAEVDNMVREHFAPTEASPWETERLPCPMANRHLHRRKGRSSGSASSLRRASQKLRPRRRWGP